MFVVTRLCGPAATKNNVYSIAPITLPPLPVFQPVHRVKMCVMYS